MLKRVGMILASWKDMFLDWNNHDLIRETHTDIGLDRVSDSCLIGHDNKSKCDGSRP